MTRTIGQRLKAAREEQRLTLEKVFEATRIRVQYLQALEEDDHSILPSAVQARGYLRNYAEFLGLDAEQMLRELRDLSRLQVPEQVIGPTDPPVVVPPLQMEDANVSPPAPAPEPPQAAADPVSAESTEAPRATAKRKTTRRKTTGSATKPATAESTTRRRGRKKIEPEAAPAVETQPPGTEESTSSVPAVSPVEEPGVVGEPALPSPVATDSQQQEANEPADVSDSLWQTWLNRVGSTLSARAKRKTAPSSDSAAPQDPVAAPIPEPEGAYEVAATPQPQADSSQILREIGKVLRQRRELLSLHFDEIERNTHVKAHYLDALERGALDELPSTVQTRGMLANYATFLDLDVDALLLRFADALQARHRERNPHKPARKPGQPILSNMPPVRSFMAGDMIFGVGMVVLLVGFAIWGVNRVLAVQNQQMPEPTSPSISDILLSYPNPSFSSPLATATFVIVDAVPGEPTMTVEIPTQNVNAAVQLNLVAVERTYMRVVVDGEVAFEGRVVPGNAYPFEAENQIEVLVGNAAAIRAVYNGRDMGLLGTFGQVVNNLYLGTGIITPTAQPSPTPTITETPTPTVPATATVPTTTPTPSATALP
jgi:cytoskeleton protein RodZ